MSFLLTTDPKKKILYIVAFFVALYFLVELTGLRARLSPETIKSLFFEHTFWGLVFFCVAFREKDPENLTPS